MNMTPNEDPCASTLCSATWHNEMEEAVDRPVFEIFFDCSHLTLSGDFGLSGFSGPQLIASS